MTLNEFSHASATSEDAHVFTFICFPPFKNSVNSLVIKHHAEVCPLSGGANLEPLSHPITGWHSLSSQSHTRIPSVRLTASLPRGREYGLTVFH